MDKKELLQGTTELASDVGRQVMEASLQSGFSLGRINHTVQYEMAWPIETAAAYLRQLQSTVGNPDVGRKVGGFNFLANARIREANNEAEKILSGMSYDTLQAIHGNAQEALSGNLAEAVLTVARGIEEGRRQMTSEEREIVTPLLKALEMGSGVLELKTMYESQ